MGTEVSDEALSCLDCSFCLVTISLYPSTSECASRRDLRVSTVSRSWLTCLCSVARASGSCRLSRAYSAKAESSSSRSAERCSVRERRVRRARSLVSSTTAVCREGSCWCSNIDREGDGAADLLFLLRSSCILCVSLPPLEGT
jgi:hypothetical protein